MKRLPFLTILFSALAVAVYASLGLTTALEFDRAAVLRGEIWRVLTGHFTHFGADHLRWDVIAFIAFGSLVELRSRRSLLICLGAAALAISFGVGVFQPQFSIYRGLSGLDSALFGFVTADMLRSGWRERDQLATSFAALALAGFLAKSIYEVTTELTVFVAPSIAFEAVPLAHLLGAGMGAALASILGSEKLPLKTATRAEKVIPPTSGPVSLAP